MVKRRGLVITSIADDKHPILLKIAEDSLRQNIDTVVIGDTKSPNTFKINGIDFYSIEEQLNLGFGLSKIAPHKHYSRKNIGYLICFERGYEVIQETDDDNIPLDKYWEDYSFENTIAVFKGTGWYNVYSEFTEKMIWPRGFSLSEIQNEKAIKSISERIFTPILQGLADENPDVDAIYRLTYPLPFYFDKLEKKVVLGQGSWCPFNSQNTLWHKNAFPLLYLPSYCSFRMTDIWRSFVAQRICWEYGWGILFHEPTVYQIRNDHNLIRDFEEEISGYLGNEKIISALSTLDLSKNDGDIFRNLRDCYNVLITLGLVGAEETPLIEAWIEDCKMLSVQNIS